MTIAVVGTGYVGLVTGACLASQGHRVRCIDIDPAKIEQLRQGKMPIHEPGLQQVVKRASARGHLTFTTSYAEGLAGARVIFIGVGTPSLPSGRANLRYVFAAAKSIATHMDAGAVIATKSTVPVGTNQRLRRVIQKQTKKAFTVASCPEFLREGSAVKDFFAPDRIVIGADDDRSGRLLRAVFQKVDAPKLVTDIASAELIKYASNAFLATKISFINEIANVSERVGADVEVVARGMGMDKRIGDKFLHAGIGYGGSCFPKDVRALNQIAGTNGYTFRLLRAVVEVNNIQRRNILQKLKRHMRTLKGKRIAVLGLAFKKNTDDVRESAALDIAERLVRAGCTVRAHDPIASVSAARVIDKRVRIYDDIAQLVRGADAVIIATEWDAFAQLDWKRIRRLMRRPLIIDGRNLLNPTEMENAGFTYEGVGR